MTRNAANLNTLFDNPCYIKYNGFLCFENWLSWAQISPKSYEKVSNISLQVSVPVIISNFKVRRCHFLLLIFFLNIYTEIYILCVTNWCIEMRFNEKELSMLAYQPAPIEGRLHHKSPGSKIREVYRERWCKLRSNFLFYCKISDNGECLEPIGALLLERCRIQHEPRADRPFVFSIVYQDDGDKKHYFVCSSDKQCQQWVIALRKASYESLQTTLASLQAKIMKRTGKDPLLSAAIQNIQDKQLNSTKESRGKQTWYT
ncbi:pleckstrin homology domain-containing family J member 1-like [Glandiceps talaboti]